MKNCIISLAAITTFAGCQPSTQPCECTATVDAPASQFEYRVETIPDDFVEKRLKEAGADGWRLAEVRVVESGGTGGGFVGQFILERPVAPK